MSVSQNRRERISERLKILQELVPNGSKVDFSNEYWEVSFFCTFIYVAELKLQLNQTLWNFTCQNYYLIGEFCRLIWSQCWRKQLVMLSFFSCKWRWNLHRVHYFSSSFDKQFFGPIYNSLCTFKSSVSSN